jgi:hypothetical protein
MNAKEQLNKIKTLLGLEVKFEQAKLVDGATVEAEQFAPEFSIGIVTEDGIVPMPVGEYETEDGQIIVVEQEGIIASVGDKPAEEPEVEVEVEAEKEMEKPVQAKRIVESVSKETFFAEIEKMKADNEALRLELQSLKAEAEKLELEAQTAEPIVHNPEASKKVELQKYGKPSTIKTNIYKQLFS